MLRITLIYTLSALLLISCKQEIKTYYPNAPQNLKEQFNAYIWLGDTTRDGPYTINYPNGVLWQEGQYLSGELTGNWIVYTDAGALNQKMQYQKNKINGVVTSFFPSGKPYQIIAYSNDKKEGELKVYYENEQLMESSSYLDDSLHGSSTGYYDNGNCSHQYQFQKFVL